MLRPKSFITLLLFSCILSSGSIFAASEAAAQRKPAIILDKKNKTFQRISRPLSVVYDSKNMSLEQWKEGLRELRGGTCGSIGKDKGKFVKGTAMRELQPDETYQLLLSNSSEHIEAVEVYNQPIFLPIGTYRMTLRGRCSGSYYLDAEVVANRPKDSKNPLLVELEHDNVDFPSGTHISFLSDFQIDKPISGVNLILYMSTNKCEDVVLTLSRL